MREFPQGYGTWVALGTAVLATWLIHALPGHHPCVFRDVVEESKRRRTRKSRETNGLKHLRSLTLEDDKYDAIIVGASFAGLAVASRLHGRVLIIDRNEIGEGQTSACATSVSLVLRLAGPEAILQVHQEGCIHLSRLQIMHPLPMPLCTFDYRKFCQSVFRRTRAQFLQAVVRGTDGERVATDQGSFRARCIVDASGWRGALAGSLNESFRRQQHLAFALESEVPATGNGLHFWLDGASKTGYGWHFPCGRFSRVGWGSYAETSGLKDRLTDLAHTLGVKPEKLHGGFLSCGLQDPVQDGVFLVGDAAGQCLPLTGEGIRPAVYFGQRCGDIIQDIVEGHLTTHQGTEEYRRLVAHFHPTYSAMERVQKLIGRTPLPAVAFLGWLSATTPLARYALTRYFHAFPVLPGKIREPQAAPLLHAPLPRRTHLQK